MRTITAEEAELLSDCQGPGHYFGCGLSDWEVALGDSLRDRGYLREEFVVRREEEGMFEYCFFRTTPYGVLALACYRASLPCAIPIA